MRKNRVTLCLSALDGIPDAALESGAISKLIQAARELVEFLCDSEGTPRPTAALDAADQALGDLDAQPDERPTVLGMPIEDTSPTFADLIGDDCEVRDAQD